jgi:hypothetical protein
MKRSNPIHIAISPMAGRTLPTNWQQNLGAIDKPFDQRDHAKLEPQWRARSASENLQRDSRLSAHPSWSELFGQR